MSKGKELAKNTLIITIGKISTQFISFFLIPLYTSYLASSDYGAVDLINTYVSLLVPVVTLQLEQAIFRFLIDARNNENEQKKVINSIFKTIIIHMMVFLIIGIIISLFLNLNYKYFLILNVLVCMISSIFLQIARGLGKTKIYTYGSMLTGTVAVLLNLILIAGFKMNASGILISNCTANILCSIFLFFSLKLYKYIKFSEKKDKKTVKSMYSYSLPLIPNSISWWVINVSDRTIISAMLGLSYNGIYSISNKFSSIYIIIYNLFNLSWTESISLYINDKDGKSFFEDTINKMFVLFSSICTLIIAFLPLCFNFLVNGEYRISYNYMPILLVASLFNVVVGLYSAIYVAKKQTKELAKSSVMCACINILVNVILIKFIGLYAAALSTFIAYFVLMVYRYIDVKKYINISLKKKNVFFTFGMVLFSIICYYINNVYLNVICFVLMAILSLLLNKEFLFNIKNTIFRKKEVK